MVGKPLEEPRLVAAAVFAGRLQAVENAEILKAKIVPPLKSNLSRMSAVPSSGGDPARRRCDCRTRRGTHEDSPSSACSSLSVGLFRLSATTCKSKSSAWRMFKRLPNVIFVILSVSSATIRGRLTPTTRQAAPETAALRVLPDERFVQWS